MAPRTVSGAPFDHAKLSVSNKAFSFASKSSNPGIASTAETSWRKRRYALLNGVCVFIWLILCLFLISRHLRVSTNPEPLEPTSGPARPSTALASAVATLDACSVVFRYAAHKSKSQEESMLYKIHRHSDKSQSSSLMRAFLSRNTNFNPYKKNIAPSKSPTNIGQTSTINIEPLRLVISQTV